MKPKTGKEIRYINIQHEEATSLHSNTDAYQASMKERIAQMHKNRQTLHSNNYVPKKSDDECYQEIMSACKRFVDVPTEENEKFLADTLEKYNMQLYCYPCSEISSDKSRIARMAFNGFVERPMENTLSKEVRDRKNKPWERLQTKPEDYNLSGSTVWDVFKQIPEFAAIEDKVKKGLSQYGIDPQKLAELNINDFCFIINDQFRGSNNIKAKVFPESYKAKHTKRFIKENEQEFRAGLLAMEGVRADYVEALIAAMKKGCTDLTKLPGYNKEWDNQPVVDVHHIINVKDCANIKEDGKNWANVDDYENMCFIVRHPSHDAMHLIEKMMVEFDDLGNFVKENIFANAQTGRKFVYRAQPPEGVRCIIGFNTAIYDKNFLGLDENTQTNLPKTAEETQKKAKALSDQFSRNNNYHVQRKGNTLRDRRAAATLKEARETYGNKVRA